jgi:spore coat polysaccharide biosynthesis protein SpsF
MSINNSIFFFLQARTGSTRLPGKVLLPFDGDNTILDIIVDRLQQYFPEISLVLCTSTNVSDDVIAEFCLKKEIDCFRGNENNVLKRFIDAAELYGVKTIVRICADNPFLDVSFLKELLEFYSKNPDADYWSFKNGKNIPAIKTHFGFFAEIVTTKCLRKVERETHDLLYLEHVTNYVYSHDGFKVMLKSLPDYLIDREDLRFTIDDKEDFEGLKEVYQFYKNNNFNIQKTISFVEDNSLLLEQMVFNIKRYSK